MEVALRKESVDRNCKAKASAKLRMTSLSARRAWIEIHYPAKKRRAGPSLSARRAWIEISCASKVYLPLASLSARRAWIEILSISSTLFPAASLSARRAWIEINYPKGNVFTNFVALRKESVDRNLDAVAAANVGAVALRKESVDRNKS